MFDHSEAVQIDFDPVRVSYEELLSVFWDSHRASQPAWSRQYMSAVLTWNQEQREAALRLKENLSRQRGELHTRIAPLGAFTLAEDYHQKYALRHQRDLMREFTVIYPTLVDLLGSTAVTRANGFASGYGTSALLNEEIASYGLSPDGQHRLRELVRRYER